jgi:hypothetical protein
MKYQKPKRLSTPAERKGSMSGLSADVIHFTTNQFSLLYDLSPIAAFDCCSLYTTGGIATEQYLTFRLSVFFVLSLFEMCYGYYTLAMVADASN